MLVGDVGEAVIHVFQRIHSAWQNVTVIEVPKVQLVGDVPSVAVHSSGIILAGTDENILHVFEHSIELGWHRRHMFSAPRSTYGVQCVCAEAKC